MSNGSEVQRFSGPQIVNYVEPPEVWKGGPVGWHNRGASFRDNAARPDCAHPYTFLKADGTSVVGFHNGIIRNHAELNKKHSRTLEVDSMHLWAHRAEGLSWKELQGWGNLVWWETLPNGKRELNFCRINDGDLHLVTFEDGTLGWCSTMAPLTSAGRMFGNPIRNVWLVREFNRYILAQDENGKDIPWETKDELRFGTTKVEYQQPQIYHPPSMAGNTRLVNPCKMCYSTNAGSEKEGLLCPACFLSQLQRFLDNEKEQREAEVLLRIIAERNTKDDKVVPGQPASVGAVDPRVISSHQALMDDDDEYVPSWAAGWAN